MHIAKVIETDQENEMAIAIAEELSHRENQSLEESALSNLLIVLIEKYEGEHYSIPESTPHLLLLHLIEARNLKETDLVEILGSRELVAAIVSRKQEITKEQSIAL